MLDTIKLKRFFVHLFFPHETNNQKAKILHSTSLAIVILFLLGFQFALNSIPKRFPSVLGFAANISASEVIRLTNEQRMGNGLKTLTENKSLSSAALAKGQDMLSKGYWAHFAPDGTSPWTFFVNFGYKYQYAGENLARDFSDANGAVVAWMNSATHKENILNPRYKEVGIGVVEGMLDGKDTTIVVQFFGTPISGAPSIPIARAESVATTAQTAPQATAKSEILAEIQLATPLPTPQLSPNIQVSPFQATKNLSMGIVGIILLALAFDLIIVRRRRIARIGGRTLAHIAYLSMIAAVILLLKAGRII